MNEVPGRVPAELFRFVAGAWCGALVFFAGTAGVVLTTAPSRHAGGLVNRALLDVLDVTSYVAGGLLFVLWVSSVRKRAWPRAAGYLMPRLIVLALAAAAVSHLIITPEMIALRDAMPAIIDLVPKSDPLRQAWGRLHGFSSFALLVRIVAVTTLFVATAFEARERA